MSVSTHEFASQAERLESAYSKMSLIRRFEEKLLELSSGSSPTIFGSIHLCAGQEAIPVGAMAALRADDRVVATYRGHGWALEAGIPADRLMAEIMHRSTGVNGGRAGSAYLSSLEHRFVGENSIVGAGGPIACGVAMAAQLKNSDRVVVVSFGDGALSQGALHEAFVFAASRSLPVLFVCEHNNWSELTPTNRIAKVERLARRAIGYGMEGVTLDGCDPLAVQNAVAAAAKRARSGLGPSLLELKTVRLWGHYNRDIQHYRPKTDKDEAAARDPLVLVRSALSAQPDVLQRLDRHDAAAVTIVAQAVEFASNSPVAEPSSATRHVTAPPSHKRFEQEAVEEELTYAKAANAAMRDDMRRDTSIVVYGEDCGFAGGIFGVTRDLQKEFGEARVFDTPIAESAILGSAVGASMDGLKPVVEVMWHDFMLVAFDSLANQAANVRYLSQGKVSAPLVVRTQQGATPGSCAQHSQSLEALIAHIPGLKVGLPSTPQDAYSMLRAAINDPDPVVVIEARSLYQEKTVVRRSGEVEGVEGARLRLDGTDVVIIAWGTMVQQALAAANELAVDGISAAVLDLRWLCPLDMKSIWDIVHKCKRVVIAHEASSTGGFGAEVFTRIQEQIGHELLTPMIRVATPDVRMPACAELQRSLIPDAHAITLAARRLATLAAIAVEF